MEKLLAGEAAGERPLIILGAGPQQWVQGAEMTEAEIAYHKLNDKWELIYTYMVEQGYEMTYGNGMFSVYQ